MEFVKGNWNARIDVQDFILRNYTPYDGDETFLEPATDRTKQLWDEISVLLEVEKERNGVYDIDAKTISGINSHASGYINKEMELIVGLQTDHALKRAIMPFGGIKLVENSLGAYNYKLDSGSENVFNYRKTHNDGVFDVYTPAMRAARRSGIITGLPDAYGRGRIIGDYRRLPLYGVDFLIEQKIKEQANLKFETMDDEAIRLREEIAEQIRALHELKDMAKRYGFDISNPATDTKEAIQWLYFAYLASIKEQNGAAMSIGRVSTFLDIYSVQDLELGRYTEEQIQEFVDDFVMKLRLVRFLRTPAYDELFSGDPTWVTEAVAGVTTGGTHMVTKMSYRFLHTLTNLGSAPEPNLTVLWSKVLPSAFKRYCADLSIKTSSIQYENDDLMRKKFGDDYGIACCVSAMKIGKQMQFFGARANLVKALLYAINGGRDEVSGEQIAPKLMACHGSQLDYDDVFEQFEFVCEWLSKIYINMLNIIHYMHDKYCYERIQMALHDHDILRTMACGIAGLSVVVDSLSAIKYAKVTPIRDERNIVIDFEIEGEYPAYGNNDPRSNEIATSVVDMFINKLKTNQTYRKSIPTLSILTITSNVVYGKKTGSTPDGRLKGDPFAPGANPMHGRDKKGCVASMMSVATVPYDSAEDGISYTFSVVPETLGKESSEQLDNLVALLDGYFAEGGHHVNVNVLHRETLLDAIDHPEKYPQLTIRVSGYAVHFNKLTREQQMEIINRTFHKKL